MASVNRVFILGNLGQDPELRYTPNQVAVATLNVATTDVRTDKDGQRQETTEWHRIVVWNKQAENCAKYLSKGRPVFVEGRLQTRSWDDKQGNKRYTTEIVAQNVTFLGGGNQAQREVGDNMGSQQPQTNNRFAQPRRPQQDQGFSGGFGDDLASGFGGPETPGLDDIPF